MKTMIKNYKVTAWWDNKKTIINKLDQTNEQIEEIRKIMEQNVEDKIFDLYLIEEVL